MTSKRLSENEPASRIEPTPQMTRGGLMSKRNRTEKRYNKMNKYNRNCKQRHRKTAEACKDTIEALKIPDYIDRTWCDQIHFSRVDPEECRTYGITNHAKKRMSQRGISKDAISIVLEFGRKVHIRNAIVYFFGRKEMKRYLKPGQNASRWTGFRDIHVLVSPSDDTIITTYKNQDITIKADF